MIRAVTFDLWQTLITEDPADEDRRRALRFERMRTELARLRKQPSLESLREAYQACGERLKQVWAQDRDVSTREQVELVLQRLKVNSKDLDELNWERLEEAYTSPIRAIPPLALPGAAETLRALSQKGLKLGLICNTGRTPGKVLRPILVAMGLSEPFGVMVFSDEFRIRKPDVRIFQKALAGLKVSPDEAVHVGDIAETDVAGARRTGMLALHLAGDGSPGSPEASGLIRSVAEVPEWVEGR